jgi:hypothetical protein
LLGSAVGYAAPCGPGSLQDYIDLGTTGCSFGGALFSNFYIAPGQFFATPIAPGAVQVTPVAPASLAFTLSQSAMAGELFESFFHFSIDAPGLGLPMATIALSATAFGDGAAIAALDVCAGVFLDPSAPLGCTGTSASAIAVETEFISIPSGSASFPGIAPTFFDVFADFTIDGGLSGSASIDSATAQVTVVPEPGTVTLLLAGCALLLMKRIRRS